MFRGSGISAGNFDQLATQFRQMIDELHQGHFFRYSEPHAWRPKVNVYETADAFYVCAELAGMPREKIEVRTEGNSLLIHGVRPRPESPEACEEHCPHPSVRVHVMEIDSGPFSRRISLPSGIEVSQISANYRNGYLWITLPKTAASARGGRS